MVGSKQDTLVYSLILVAPLATALVYIADARAPAPVAQEIVDCPPPIAAPQPTSVVHAIVEPAPAPAPAPAPTIAPPIVDPSAGAGVLMFDHRLVFSTDPVPAWGKGPLRSHANEYGVTVSKLVDPAQLPADLAASASASFTVFAADGSSCLVDAGPLSVYARLDGDIMIYADDGDSEDGPTAAQRNKLRRDVYAEHATLLLARTSNQRCDGLWARRTDLPAPAVFVARNLPVDADQALTASVATMVAAEPAVAALALNYAAWHADLDAETRAMYPAWSDYYTKTLVVRRWDEVGGPRSYLNVDVGSVGEACGNEFAEHTSLLLERSGDTWQVLDDPGFWRPDALMDLDRDGHLEAVTGGGRTLTTAGPDASFAQSFEISWVGCPC